MNLFLHFYSVCAFCWIYPFLKLPIMERNKANLNSLKVRPLVYVSDLTGSRTKTRNAIQYAHNKTPAVITIKMICVQCINKIICSSAFFGISYRTWLAYSRNSNYIYSIIPGKLQTYCKEIVS